MVLSVIIRKVSDHRVGIFLKGFAELLIEYAEINLKDD